MERRETKSMHMKGREDQIETIPLENFEKIGGRASVDWFKKKKEEE